MEEVMMTEESRGGSVVCVRASERQRKLLDSNRVGQSSLWHVNNN